MNIPQIIWYRVVVTCPEYPQYNTEVKNATVTIGEYTFPEGALSIREVGPDKPKSMLYSKAKITALSPESFKATAFYWRSKQTEEGKWEDWETPIEVEGYF